MSFSNSEEQLIIKGDTDVLVKPANLESQQEYALQQEEWPNAMWVQHMKVKNEEDNALMKQMEDAWMKHMLDARYIKGNIKTFRKIIQDFELENDIDSEYWAQLARDCLVRLEEADALAKQIQDAREIKAGRENIQELEQKANLESQQEEFSVAMWNQQMRVLHVNFKESTALTKQMMYAGIKQMLDARYIKGYIKAGREMIQKLEQKNDKEQRWLQLMKYFQVRLEEADARAKQADLEMLNEAKVSEEKAMIDAACFADDLLSKSDALEQDYTTKTILQQTNDLWECWQADLGMLSEAKVSEEKAMVDAACFAYDLLSGQAHTLQQEILPKTILQEMNGLQIS